VSLAAAQTLVRIVGVYVTIGLLFAVVFVWRLVGRLDPAARHGTTGFRVLILPGVIALWPYLAARLAFGASAPPEEWTAHRRSARRHAQEAEARP
jgi:hypothetical protein